MEALSKSARKRVVCLFSSDGDAAHSLVESWAATSKPPCTLITLEWECAPRLSNELEDTVIALARAAASLYPGLYASAKDRADDHMLRSEEAPKEQWLERAAGRAAKGNADVSLHAARRILSACRREQLPLLASLPRAERLRQLALAIDPLRLVIELLVSDPELPAPGSLLALAKGADWLAHNSGARVIMVLPERFSECRELDQLAFGRDSKAMVAPANENVVVRDRRPSNGPSTSNDTESRAAPVATTTTAPIVTVAAVLGRPHPASDAEILLHRTLSTDAELSSLFSYNQLVKTKHGLTPRVDLLWEQGRLVIELDGHPDHARKRKFCEDRVRDYYLMISGYQVLRFSDMAILTDVELMVERIRAVVRYLQEKAS